MYLQDVLYNSHAFPSAANGHLRAKACLAACQRCRYKI